MIFHRSFKKDYKQAPESVQQKFDERLRVFVKHPFDALLNNHPLTGDRKGQWSINITGDYRAIYERSADNETVFTALATHSKLYE